MFVITFKPGRLANRLILYANFIAYVTEYGGRVLNPSFDEYTPYFRGTVNNSLGRYPKPLTIAYNSFLNRWVYRFMLFISRIAMKAKLRTKLVDYLYLETKESMDMCQASVVSSGKIIFIHGWLFRAGELLKKHQQVVRQTFEPVKEIKENVQAFIAKQRTEVEVLVGVHIRRGDYRYFNNGIYFYTDAQYQQLMADILSILPDQNIKFILCSDESLEEFHCSDVNWATSTNHLIEDLYILSECDYIIGPPSTYSAWASFYGQVPLFHIEKPEDELQLTSFKIGLT